MNPANVKVNLPAPVKWKVTDAHTKDPVQFLREVHNHAVCVRQDLARALNNLLDPNLSSPTRSTPVP